MELPLFPMSGIVLFPRMVIPLHIDEERLVQMIRDIQALDPEQQFIVLATTLEGEEDKTNPEIYSTGTVCKVVELMENPDGTFDIILVGLISCEIDELFDWPRPYRFGRIDPVEEDWTGMDTSYYRSKILEYLRSDVIFLEKQGISLVETSFDKLLALVCMALPISVERRINLLRENQITIRAEMILELLESFRKLKPFVPTFEQLQVSN